MYDLILKNGLIVDGKRTKPYKADLCIKDGKIATITTEANEAKEIVDVNGLAVTPGFIDIHCHSDAVPFFRRTPEGKIRQGVTTEISGNCGGSILPGLEETRERYEEYMMGRKGHPGFMTYPEYAKALNEIGHVCNCGALLGHSNLRIAVMGFVNRDPDAEEMEQLKALLEREMQLGAFGMSLGLIYPPSAFSAKEELVELSKIIAKYDGILSVHMRNEGPRIFEAVDEMIEIAERSGVHVQISHLKLMGVPQWGKAAQLIEKIDAARARGLNITCDQYPFTASSTALSALVPHWAHDGGSEGMLGRLENEFDAVRPELLQEMANRGGPDTILVSSCKAKSYVGKYIGEIAKELGVTTDEAVRRVLLESKNSTQCIYFSINEQDIHHIMKQLYVCVGSDGTAHEYEGKNNLHPRTFAAFSQYFQTVRENGLLPLEDMVFKATGLSAQILGLTDRGTLEVGKWADIAVFDPNTFASQSTFLSPNHPPVGMQHVLVNGKFSVRDDKLTGEAPGVALVKK